VIKHDRQLSAFDETQFREPTTVKPILCVSFTPVSGTQESSLCSSGVRLARTQQAELGSGSQSQELENFLVVFRGEIGLHAHVHRCDFPLRGLRELGDLML
jgi:hypothetical protein